MRSATLVRRSLLYYWRTHAAVAAGIAVAVAVLSGALLVGDSVRGSLRDLVLERLGRADYAVLSSNFVREGLSENVAGDPDFQREFSGICPLFIGQGVVSAQSGDGRIARVAVYGVDDRFWRFHRPDAGVGAVSGPASGGSFLSPSAALEIGAAPGDTVLLRIPRPSDIPLEWLHGRRQDVERTLRLDVTTVLPPESLGEFSLQARQGEVPAVFVSLEQIQEDLELGKRVNAMLVAAKEPASARTLERLLRTKFELDDFGIDVRPLQTRHLIALEGRGGLLGDAAAQAGLDTAAAMDLKPQRIFTYLANTIRLGEREVPYSLVTAIDLPGLLPPDAPAIVLNSWAARELEAGVSDVLSLDYFVWEEPGRLVTRTQEFVVAGIVPVSAGDRELAPPYPGITSTDSLTDWDPPFPIDLRKVRPADEEYWKTYRTTPKAFISFEVGRKLWQSRYGGMTSIRLASSSPLFEESLRAEYASRLRAALDPLAAGLTVRNIRGENLEASRGATDFGEYFVYFSFFLVAAALMLAALFFKLNVEQRVREAGLLRAIGLPPSLLRRLFLTEGLLLCAAGGVLGAAGAVAYAKLVVAALGSWWSGAVGTTALRVHLTAESLGIGAAGGILAAMICLAWTLRGFSRVSARTLLSGQTASEAASGPRQGGFRKIVSGALALAGFLLIAGGASGYAPPAAAFFGAGASLLASALLFVLHRLSRSRAGARPLSGAGWKPIGSLGFRNARYRPVRSVVVVSMIALATFVVVSVGAFRKPPATESAPGAGGYSLFIETVAPVAHDPESVEGRSLLGLDGFEPVRIEPLRLRPGDDTSCLNLYEPKNPRILGVSDRLIEASRFAFRDSLARTDAERANPWLLLQEESGDVIPVIADSNSLAYVLHRRLGDEIVLDNAGRPVRLRIVAALDDSIFQGELLMSESHFRRAFPEEAGYRAFLAETGGQSPSAVAAAIEDALRDYGADAKPTPQRLAEFHRVENTYLATFQMLGGLGLLLGTVGLGAVLARNALERRRETALLTALGYRRAHLLAMGVFENLSLLAGGLAIGAACALVAIAPVVSRRGGALPDRTVLALLGGVLACGVLIVLASTALTFRTRILEALKSE